MFKLEDSFLFRQKINSNDLELVVGTGTVFTS